MRTVVCYSGNSLHRKRHGCGQYGFTMIELLVAMMVLGVGLAGVMAMDRFSVRKNYQAFLRTQAVLQVQELAERMHANPDGVVDGDYVGTIPTSVPSPNCLSASCSTTQLATFDLWEWNDGNKKTLPSGAGSITRSGLEHTVTVSWSENTQKGTLTKSFSFVYKPIAITEPL